LVRLSFKPMRTLDRFITDKPAEPLYHYTDAAGLIGIVENGCLWASDYRHLNDRKEYRLGAELLQKEIDASQLDAQQRRAFHKLVAKTQKTCFVLSFSEKRDQLSQWRAYCPSGNGYSLGFGQHNALFQSAKQSEFNLVRCVYDRAEQRELCQSLISGYTEVMIRDRRSYDDAAARAREHLERYQWNLALYTVVGALKHSGFKEEKEWRLISQYPNDLSDKLSFRSGRFGVTPFFKLPIDFGDGQRRIETITIGPSSNRTAARTALDLLLFRYDTEVETVKLSSTPFRR
jgi:Protein of unknown function (DUF2971)